MNSSRTVLLVDDDKDDQFFFKEAVRTISDHIFCNFADNGSQGIKFLETQERPDMIFLDLNMPGMNGFEFLKSLHTRKDFSEMPVIIYTTSSRLSDIQEARTLGARAFLTKPHDIRDLELKLRKAFELNYSELRSLYVIV